MGLWPLLPKTVVKSPKGVRIAAYYPTYLVLREFWARQNMEMIIIDRHYCPHG